MGRFLLKTRRLESRRGTRGRVRHEDEDSSALEIYRELDWELDVGLVIDLLSCWLIVGCGRFVNVVDERLRVAIDQREPRALHLHHDAMARPKNMVGGVEINGVFVHFVGLHRFRLLETVAESPAKHVVGDHQLIARQLFIIVRIRVDQLNDPIRIGAGGRRENMRHHVARDHNIGG